MIATDIDPALELALHDAGHAAAVMYITKPADYATAVTKLALTPTPTGGLTSSCYWRDLPDADELFVLCSGPAATLHFNPQHPDPWGLRAADTDWPEAQRLLAKLPQGKRQAALDAAKARAEDFVEYGRRGIMAVADALVKKGSLTGAEIGKLA